MFYYMLSAAFTEKFYSHISGLIGGVSISEIKTFPLVLPPSYEQKYIANFLDAKCTEVDAVIAQTKTTIEEYKKLKQSVITQAVTKGIRSDRPMKDSGIEWIGDIPREWNISKVKNVATTVTDGAHISPETDDGVYDFVSTVNIGDGAIDFTTCLKTSPKSYEYLVRTGCKPQKNDILISKDGTVGKTVVLDFDRDFVVASSLVIIRPNLQIVSPTYLNYNLQSKFVQDSLVMVMHGAGLKRVSVQKNANLTVVLPPIKEQEEIVTYLNQKCTEIDALITKKTALLEELETYKKSVIYEYVTGKKEI